MRPGQPPMRRIAAERVGEAALRLPQPEDVVREAPLRPAPRDLRGVEPLERHGLGGQAVGVVGHRDGRVGRPQVQTAGDGDDPFAGLALDLGPRLVGALGETDVVGPVVGEPDDPAVIGRGAVGMIDLEPLEAQDAIAERAAEPVRRGRADRPEPDDDRVPVADGSVIDPPLRSSASRLTAMTVIASVIRPSRVIASTSANGSQRTARSSVPSGLATPDDRPVARKITADSSETEFERCARAISRQSAAVTPVSSSSSRRAPSSALSPVGTPPSGISHE